MAGGAAAPATAAAAITSAAAAPPRPPPPPPPPPPPGNPALGAARGTPRSVTDAAREVLRTNGYFLVVELEPGTEPPSQEAMHPDGKTERTFPSGRTQVGRRSL